jgi:hypothetical protein
MHKNIQRGLLAAVMSGALIVPGTWSASAAVAHPSPSGVDVADWTGGPSHGDGPLSAVAGDGGDSGAGGDADSANVAVSGDSGDSGDSGSTGGNFTYVYCPLGGCTTYVMTGDSGDTTTGDTGDATNTGMTVGGDSGEGGDGGDAEVWSAFADTVQV